MLRGPEPHWGIRDSEHLESIIRALLTVDQTLANRSRPGIARPRGAPREQHTSSISRRNTGMKRIRVRSRRRTRLALGKNETETLDNGLRGKTPKNNNKQRIASNFDRESSMTRSHLSPGFIREALSAMFCPHETSAASTSQEFKERTDSNHEPNAFTDKTIDVNGRDTRANCELPLALSSQASNWHQQRHFAQLTEGALRALNRQQKPGTKSVRRGSRQALLSTNSTTEHSHRSRNSSRHSERSHPEQPHTISTRTSSALSRARSSSAHSLAQSTTSASTSATTSRHPLAFGRQRESNRVTRENLLLADRLLRIEVGRGPYNRQKQLDSYTRNVTAILPPIPTAQLDKNSTREQSRKIHPQ